MAEILQNEQVSDDFYLMKVKKKIRLQWGSFICYVHGMNTRSFPDRSVYLMQIRRQSAFCIK